MALVRSQLGRLESIPRVFIEPLCVQSTELGAVGASGLMGQGLHSLVYHALGQAGQPVHAGGAGVEQPMS